jgi:hypothetical protein
MLHSLHCYCVTSANKPIIRRHFYNSSQVEDGNSVRPSGDIRLEEHMDDAFLHFEEARSASLSAEERVHTRQQLGMFVRVNPLTGTDPVAVALGELATFSLPIIDKLEVRASLRASIGERVAPAMPVFARKETGFVSMFSSMLNHRVPVLA